MPERSRYQEKVIKNYYKHQDAILLDRLSDLVSKLYLAEGKVRARLWKNAAEALEKLELPKSRIEHLLKQDDPALLAGVVQELLGKK